MSKKAKRIGKILLIGFVISLFTASSWYLIKGFSIELRSFSKEVYGVSIDFEGFAFSFKGLVQEEEVSDLEASKKDSSNKMPYGVSAAHPLAVEVGMEVLRQGGNAVDASIAVAYALGVVEPYGSGIGGGGAMLIHPTDGKEPVLLDYREVYPYSGKATGGIGVPGFIKGMEAAHQEFGSLDFDKLINPAIKLAEEGFVVNGKLTERLRSAKYRLPVKESPHFFPGGQPIKKGALLKQPELAETLKEIKRKGSTTYYEGGFAKAITGKVKGLKLTDFKSYIPRKLEPVRGEFAGFDVVSAPAPLGGITLIQALQMAELLQIDKAKSQTDFIHLAGEINKRTYRDRLTQIADTSFVNVPSEILTSENYSLELAKDIDVKRLSKIYFLDDTPAELEEHNNTTHFVVVDKSGMMVSTTNTLSNFFGSGTYVEGFFLNNQMFNFSNSSSSINRAESGKRPRSYLTPTILVKDGKPIMGIGSPGGRRIPAVIAQVLLKYLSLEKGLEEAVAEPRFFIEEDKVYLEGDLSQEVKKELRIRGYTLVPYKMPEYYGAIQALVINSDNNELIGIADPRRDGTWQVEKP